MGNSGIRDFQVSANSFCVFTKSAFAVWILREVRSAPEGAVRTRYGGAESKIYLFPFFRKRKEKHAPPLKWPSA